MRKFCCVLALGIIFISVLTCVDAPAQDANAMVVFYLEKGKAYYFGSEWKNTYYEFNVDGTYREISTDQSSSGEADKGHWKQIEDGRLRLVSEMKFHDLYSDIMYISVYRKNDLERLAKAKAELRKYVDREKKDKFTRYEIENLVRYKTKGNVSQNVIGVVPYRSHVTRAELEKFLTDIDSYIAGEAKGVSFITPYLYKSKVLLAIPSDLIDDDDNPEKIKKNIDTARAPYKWSSQIVEIDKNKFESDTAKFQHPYKNELIEEDESYQRRSSAEVAMVRKALEIVTFPKGQDLFFTISEAHTTYLVLRADGSYSETESAHAGVAQLDSGKWAQGSDRIINLISEKRYNDICAGWLEVTLYNDNEVRALPELKNLIKNFLTTHKEGRFTRKEIIAITKNSLVSKSSVPKINFFLSADSATRKSLEELLTQIDQYILNKNKNVFKLTPYEYKSYVFLMPENAMSDVEDVVEYFDHGWHPSFIFVASDKKTFEEGVGKPQSFKYFPELNKKSE